MKNLNTVFNLLLFPFLFLRKFSLSRNSSICSHRKQWKRGEKFKTKHYTIRTLTIMLMFSSMATAACPLVNPVNPEFTFNIEGNETGLTGLSGGPYNISDNYWEINATTAVSNADINGTLRINLYAKNFNDICLIELLDENCVVVPGYNWSNIQKKELDIFINMDKKYYLHMDDNCNNNPQVVVAMLWFPDTNLADTNVTNSGYGNSNSLELGLFKGTDIIDINDPQNGVIRTKIVNKEHNISVSVVKDDNSIATKYKGSFMMELVDSTNHSSLTCKQLPLLKYDGILGIKSNDNGQMVTGDNSTEHGPPLSYDKAVRNVSYRMSYLVDYDPFAIIDYDTLIVTTGCLGNTQSCLWGVLSKLASTKQDPNLPDFTIQGVCGIYCDPGNGTGNNQVSQECADCVFGQFGYADCSDNFAIRPDKFDVNITSATPPFTAGEPTSLAFKALDGNTTPQPTLDYNELEPTSFTVDINISDATKICQKQNIDMTPDVDFTDGLDEGDFIFDDVGDVNMTIHEIIGSEFAIIDADDTPEYNTTIGGISIDGRLITEGNASFRIIPDHFSIEGNFTDHHISPDQNFTYLSDFAKNAARNAKAMASEYNLTIMAKKFDDDNASNYTNGCFAKDLNITIVYDTLNADGTSVDLSTTDLSKVQYYEKNIDIGNTYHKQPIGTDINYSFSPAIFDEDINGTALLQIDINMDRHYYTAINPFIFTLNNIALIDTDNVTGADSIDQNATYFSARAKSSQYFYDDETSSPVNTPISVVVYCALGLTECSLYGINKQTDEFEWYLSRYHNTNNTFDDGNITLIADVPSGGSVNPADPSIVAITSEGINNGVNVSGVAPNTVNITFGDSTGSAGTNNWLIYNPYADSVPVPFYKVRFIGVSGWAGHGDTGHVVEDDPSTKKNRRLGW